ncbi:MAG: ArsA family ATPase [Deltaproteobacteria bacterium]|nr:ArsA family ATPase [Deltaproteobacteria bacterium]
MTGAALTIAALVRSKRVLVLCGPGGVGKTTTSAALGVAGALAGRRVLVLTIDPARRLADALGLPLSAPTPRPVPPDRLRALGIDLGDGGRGGTLDAWMLDPRVVFERVVRMLGTPAQAEKILSTKLFAHMSELAAGMLEYTAGEALYSFAAEGRYDLIVLDTPPSRNALDFLDAPERLSSFLEDGVLKAFIPREGSGFLASAGRLVGNVFARAFGDGFVGDLQIFFQAFGGLFGGMRAHSDGVARLLSSDESAFLLVTSPEEDALREASFFQGELARRKLPFAGFVLNRSLARLASWPHPSTLGDSEPALARALAKLAPIADDERRAAEQHASLLAELRRVAGEDRLADAAPMLLDTSDPLAGLVTLARALA